ncbi:hypothetical protein ABBQ38_004890 [Trebouxia sp. C0009 RCD-2024]
MKVLLCRQTKKPLRPNRDHVELTGLRKQEGWLQLLLPGDLDLGRFPTDGSGNEMQDDASTEGAIVLSFR